MTAMLCCLAWAMRLSLRQWGCTSTCQATGSALGRWQLIICLKTIFRDASGCKSCRLA